MAAIILLKEDCYLWWHTITLMETNRPVENIGEVSMDQIITSIRDSRDRQIEELKKEPVLMAFLEHYYNTLVISEVKKQFLLKDLDVLKNSPLDLSHYSAMITQMKVTQTSIIDGSHKLFLSELKNIFQKYVSKID
jgi:hypothetical protein